MHSKIVRFKYIDNVSVWNDRITFWIQQWQSFIFVLRYTFQIKVLMLIIRTAPMGMFLRSEIDECIKIRLFLSIMLNLFLGQFDKILWIVYVFFFDYFQVSANGNVLRSEIVGCIKMRVFLSGMPELRLGLNDKVLFESTGSKFLKHHIIVLKWRWKLHYIIPNGNS